MRQHSPSICGISPKPLDQSEGPEATGLRGAERKLATPYPKSVPLAERTEDLALRWRSTDPIQSIRGRAMLQRSAPAEHVFEIWHELRKTAAGRQFLDLAGRLFAAADAFL